MKSITVSPRPHECPCTHFPYPYYTYLPDLPVLIWLFPKKPHHYHYHHHPPDPAPE